MDSTIVYISTFLEKFKMLIGETVPKDTTLVFLKTKQLSMWNYEVPELEDKVFASKIEVMFVDIPVLAKYRKNLVNLKWAHTAWNGVDILMKTIDKDEPLPSFTLTKTPGSLNAQHISEYVIGYIIAQERLFFKAMESQQNCKWEQMIYAHTRRLSSVTIGILGAGEIGQSLAKVCKEFKMTVWGLTRREHPPEARSQYIDVYRTKDSLEELLENCDYICNILPSTPETKDMLSGNVLEKCKTKKSILINVGRGDVVDEESIVKAINNGWLGGAVLDVFNEEPLPPSSPLWKLPGVIVTPHVSGWSADDEHLEKVLSCFVANINRYVTGQPLKGALDWSQGY